MNNKKDKTKSTKVFLLTYEELERFDLLMTSAMQAYWALTTQRALNIPTIKKPEAISPEEDKFYQLHLDFNSQLDPNEK
jgi:hypothetical protein